MKSLIALAAVIPLVLAACIRRESWPDAPTSPPSVTCILMVGVTPAAATLHVGDTLTVRAIGTPSCSGSAQYGWRWLSSDTAIAAVDSASGLVRAKSRGVVTIVSVAVEEPNVKGASAITVTP